MTHIHIWYIRYISNIYKIAYFLLSLLGFVVIGNLIDPTSEKSKNAINSYWLKIKIWNICNWKIFLEIILSEGLVC